MPTETRARERLFKYEEIGDLALRFLLRAPEDEREDMMEWAAGEFRRFDLGDPSASDPHQFVMDAIYENPMLGDWMRARFVSEENVLNAEDFRDLIDRLTPAYGD